MYLNRF